jgi:hypothetical protein
MLEMDGNYIKRKKTEAVRKVNKHVPCPISMFVEGGGLQARRPPGSLG